MHNTDQTIELLRHQLGSVDLSDIEDKEMTEGERKEYCASISAVFPRLEKDIKHFLHQQLLFVSNSAENWEQVVFGRGTFNGINLLLEHWEKAHLEHQERGREDRDFDRASPIGEL